MFILHFKLLMRLLTEKKRHNLKIENYGYSADFLMTQAWKAASQIALRDCSEEVREKPGYIGVLQQKPGSQNIKRLL